MVGTHVVEAAEKYQLLIGPSLTGKTHGNQLPPAFHDGVEILPQRFYWATVTATPRPHLYSEFIFYNTDNKYCYEPFFHDFGPLNLGNLYGFCQDILKKLRDPALKDKVLIYYCTNHPHYRANSAFLTAGFMLSILGYSAADAVRPFKILSTKLPGFRDATYGNCSYDLTIQDCIGALEYATRLGWWNFDTFDHKSYNHYRLCANGDLNWIIPNKFVAFSGPNATPIDEFGYDALTPEDYVPILKKLSVTLVVRLNKKQYDKQKFVNRGIDHMDLFYVDGSCPSRDVIKKFLTAVESPTHDRVGVHCKAGLGRTGTLIGCYAMKHYHFPARLWIGWNRLCRPGSILGPQQQFLLEIESEMQSIGRSMEPPRNLLDLMLSKLSFRDQETAKIGDSGQGERLVQARRPGKSSHTKTPVMAVESVPFNNEKNNAYTVTKETERSSRSSSESLFSAGGSSSMSSQITSECAAAASRVKNESTKSVPASSPGKKPRGL